MASAIRKSRRLVASVVAIAPAAVAALVIACGADEPSTTAPPGTSQVSPPQTAAGQTIDLAGQEAAMVVWGIDKGDFLNDLPLLAAGDVNGDGLDDLLIGARFGDGPDNSRPDAGEAYVVFGSERLPSSVDLAKDEQDVTIYGEIGQTANSPNGDELGFSGLVADVNADGIDDVLLGAPFALRGDYGVSVGIVHVFFGGPQLPGKIDLAERKADVTLVGGEESGYFGDSLASTDVNGDDVADIIVGATFSGGQNGAAYVFFGSAELAGTKDVSAGQFDAAIVGADVFDELGDNVAGGDVNGDGFGDIIMTAEAADGPDNAREVAAEVYIMYGSADLSGTFEIAQGAQDVTIYGAEQNDTIGFNIASGDLNGDGVDDVLAVARLADGAGNAVAEAGEVHIIFGSSSLPNVIDLAAPDSSAYVFGTDPADLLGASLAAADLDGNGTDELLAGTGYGDGPGNSRPDGGEVYILPAGSLSGGADIAKTPRDIVVYGAGEGDRLGAAMTTADLDGDGTLELVILASEGDGPDGSRRDAGQIYILTLPS